MIAMAMEPVMSPSAIAFFINASLLQKRLATGFVPFCVYTKSPFDRGHNWKIKKIFVRDLRDSFRSNLFSPTPTINQPNPVIITNISLIKTFCVLWFFTISSCLCSVTSQICSDCKHILIVIWSSLLDWFSWHSKKVSVMHIF